MRQQGSLSVKLRSPLLCTVQKHTGRLTQEPSRMRTKSWTPEPWDEPLKSVAKSDESAEKKEEAADAGSSAHAAPSAGPDGGLSWFIAALCFLVNLLFSSFFRCGGLFFTSIMTTYEATRGYASLPLSMYSGFTNLSGLIAGPLIHWFGVRAAAVLGGFVMATGCMISYFATGIPFLVGSLGVLAGSGHGILYGCVIVAINEYFDKRRGVALGINLTGATAASFVFPSIFDLLLSEYGLHGTLAITGALLLNIPVLGFLFRKPPWQESVIDTSEAVKKGAQKFSAEQITTCSLKNLHAEDGKPSTVVARHTTVLNRRGILVAVPDEEAITQKRLTLCSQPEGLTNRNPTVENALHDTTTEDEMNMAWSRRGTLLSVAGSLLEEEKTLSSRRGTLISLTRKGSTIGDLDLRKIALLQEAVEHLTTINTAPTACEENAAFLESAPITEERSRVGSEPSFVGEYGGAGRAVASRRSTVTSLASRCQIELPCKTDEPIRILIHAEQDRSSDSALISAKEVLRLPRFYCHMLSYFSYVFFLDTFLAVAVDYAVDVGIDSVSAVFVLTFFSVTDTIGRLFVPLLTDYKLVSPLSLMCLSYLAMAVIAHSMPYAQNLVPFWTCMITLGLPVGYILVAVSEAIAVEVGLRNLPIAYGFVAGLTGVGAFFRPVVIGFFRDRYGSYDGLFRTMGSMVLCSFLLTAPLWVLDRRRTSLPATSKAMDSDDIVTDVASAPSADHHS
ncbi:uncharacterized protein [Dermacentor andersoni]|uniref:uncharacterized protein n=1 Tax=Dermacentor andersoni TaxID=34620 RepID=UPI002155F01A|nr:uncharacterized protein LOC126524450 [Dermacentor andersoni]